MHNYLQGSTWRKWDLHLHSPLSILNNNFKRQDGQPDWDAFLGRIEEANLAVIGITDYFTIDGYKKLKEFKEAGHLPQVATILPNIEFRLDKVLASKKDGGSPRRLNFHIIFSEEVPVGDIEEHFLHDIDFYYEGDPQSPDDCRKLKRSNLESLGKRLRAEHSKFESLSDIEVGARQAVVPHEAITKLLQTKRFKGKYVVVFPEELSNLIDWDGQDHLARKNLLQKSDMVFSSNPKTRDWCLGRESYTEGPDKFLKEFKSFKPCIHGSDAHDLDTIGRPCVKRGSRDHDCGADLDCEMRYCWIKGDPTFEGLKQLIYEPADRVAIQQNDPTPVKSNFTIKRFRLSPAHISEELSLAEADIPLNDGLVAITGGKGSGKTALVDLIANCYQDRCSTQDPNSFVKRISDHAGTLRTGLTFRNDVEFEKTLAEETFVDDGDVVYIAQGELEEYIGDSSDLHKYIEELIFDSPQVKDTKLQFDFNELADETKQERSRIRELNSKIVKLEVETADSQRNSLTEGSKKKVAELTEVQARLKESSERSPVDHDDNGVNVTDRLQELKNERDSLIKVRQHLQQAKNFVETDLRSFNISIGEINQLLGSLNFDAKLPEAIFDDEKKIDMHLVKVRDRLSTIVEQSQTEQQNIEALEEGAKKLAKLRVKEQELQKEVAELERQKTDLGDKRIELDRLKSNRREALYKLLSTTSEKARAYNASIAAFSAQKGEVLGDLEFFAEIRFDRTEFLNQAEQHLHNRKVTVHGDDSDFLTFLSLVSNAESSSLDSASIDAMVDRIEQLFSEMRTKMKVTTEGSTFHNWLYHDYFSVIPRVRYKGTNLEKLSLGQKATVLLKIYLAQGTKPIIIDSHDDHLDNAYIMDELVRAIRQAKEYRQIILASNNGNVVVNSDAEQLIIAKRENGQIYYESGSLENPAVHREAVKVCNIAANN